MFILHNIVNIRKRKKLQETSILDKYKSINVIQAYNGFANVYRTKGNMRLLTDTFQRQLIISDFKKWLVANLINFQ